MRPSPFRYHRADSLDHALDLLAEFGEDGRPIAGGQSLVPMMNLRLARPEHLVDINDLPLTAIEVDGAVLRIGSLVRHQRLLEDGTVKERLPVLAEAVHWIGHPTIRGRGTIGGSISHADPTAELPSMALLHDARIVAASRSGERRIPATDFFKGAFETALLPGEMVTAVEFPLPAGPSAGAFLEVGERRGDFATASVGVLLGHDGRSITAAAMVCSGAELRPIRATLVERHLAGRPLADAGAAEAARAFAASIDPVNDHVAGSEYRRGLIAELTRRAIDTACLRATG